MEKCIFLNENCCILIEFSINLGPKGSIDNKLSLVQVITQHRTGNKPIPEPKRVSDALWYHRAMMS